MFFWMGVFSSFLSCAAYLKEMYFILFLCCLMIDLRSLQMSIIWFDFWCSLQYLLPFFSSKEESSGSLAMSEIKSSHFFFLVFFLYKDLILVLVSLPFALFQFEAFNNGFKEISHFFTSITRVIAFPIIKQIIVNKIHILINL